MDRLNRRALVRIGAVVAAGAIGAATRIMPHVSPAAQNTPTSSSEWDDVVAAANKEGRLALLTFGNTWGGATFRGFRGVAQMFEQSFPSIKVDWLGEASSSVWLDRVRQARRTEAASFDIALVQPNAALTQGVPEGMWAPIKPLLFREDVLDDKAWRDGVSARYLDTGGSLCFDWEYQVIHMCAVNAVQVHDGEITTVQDLLAPKWTGKIIARDPRLGMGLHAAAAIAKTWGTSVLKQLLVDQHPTFAAGVEPIAEGLVSGRYAIGLGLRPKALVGYSDQGRIGKVKFLDLPDADVVATTSILYFDRAPHPAAAKLFSNWILTRAGQQLLTSSLPTNSARLDVDPFELTGIATIGKTYYEPDRETNYTHTDAAKRFIQNLPGGIRVIT